MHMYQKYKTIIWISVLTITTFLIYFKSINYDFVAWDDDEFIINNEIVHELSFDNLKSYFTEFSLEGYYPITLLSLAIDYAIGDGNPFVFHLINLILHIFNTVLVFYFIKLIIPRIEVAFITALLFAIHPMHVESVAWITERKDLLYTFFFFISLIFYNYFIDKEKKSYYGWSLVFFLVALLSKGQAVSLAIVIFAIDYIKGKNLLSKKLLLQKLPFLVLAIVFGVIAIFAEESGNIISSSLALKFNFFERIALASYSFVIYIVKLIVPYSLSSFYPYPELVNDKMPLIYWIFIPIAIFVLTSIVFLVKKSKKEAVFALLFYVINIALLVKLIPVTDALLADRYTYVSGIGIFIFIGLGYSYIMKNKMQRILGGSILAIYIVLLGYLSFIRIDIWKNSMTFFDSMIKENPENVIGYNNRGIYFKNLGLFPQALQDFNKAIELNPSYTKAIQNRGITLYEAGRFHLALNDLNIVLALDSLDVNAYVNRGLVLNKLGDFELAISDFEKSIELSKETPQVLMNLGNSYLYLEQFEKALEYYNKSLELKPKYAEALANRGNLKVNYLGKRDGLGDFEKALKIDPDNAVVIGLKANTLYNQGEYEDAMIEFSRILLIDPENAEAAYYRANCKYALQNYNEAIVDYTLAIQNDGNFIDAYVNRGSTYFQFKEYELALRDYNTALEIEPNSPDAYNNRGITKYFMGDYEEAIQNFSRALQFDYTIPSAYYFRGLAYMKLNRKKIGCRDLQVAQQLGFADGENAYNLCN